MTSLLLCVGGAAAQGTQAMGLAVLGGAVEGAVSSPQAAALPGCNSRRRGGA